VFVFALAVPALLVVLLGYVVGYGLWAALAGDTGAEAAGWVTGTLLLVGVVVAAARWQRLRSRRRG
jgi:hypothetical protein